MRRRKIILGILALVVLGILAAALWPEPPEPVYKDRKLSEWVVEIAHTDSSGEWHREAEACGAIEAIGTNGIPFYVKWMTFRPSFLRKAIHRLAQTSRPWVNFHFSPADDKKIDRAIGAGFALEVLGPRAATAVPSIISASADLDEYLEYRLGGIHTMRILYYVAPVDVSWVLRFMTNANPRVRAKGVQMAWSFTDTSVVNRIKISLRDPDERVRAAATNYIRVLKVGIAHPADEP